MENPGYHRAQFDSALVMVRHIVEVCADDQLARHIYRQLEREAAKVKTRLAQAEHEQKILAKCVIK